MTISDFAKLNFIEKMLLIEQKAVLIDSYIISDQRIKTYSIFDFFTEVILGAENDYITDIIPYKRGFRVSDEINGQRISA